MPATGNIAKTEYLSNYHIKQKCNPSNCSHYSSAAKSGEEKVSILVNGILPSLLKCGWNVKMVRLPFGL